MIKDFVEGTSFKGPLLVINMSKGVTNSGESYLNITLQDSSGHIEGKKWKATEEEADIFAVGNVCYVEGDVYLYKTDLQMKILSGSKVEVAPGDLNEFLASAPIPRTKLLDKFTSYLAEIDNEQIKSVLNEIFKSSMTSFSIYPAASKNHHEYVSGLIHHTTSMLDVAKSLLNLYPNLDKNYLYAGIMLHDVGKIEELSGPAITKYTTEGKLLGHISIISARVAEACKKLNIDKEISIVLQHLVLSHHGLKEYGSPVEPCTREAELIYLIDNIDSKMNMIEKALDETEVGEFSQRINSLDSRSFFKAHKTSK